MTKVIIIEDDSAIRAELEDWLFFEGFEVFSAPNGRLGLEAIYQHQPDLILCDVLMPEMDGHEVLLNVRSSVEFQGVPFIFLTAAVDREAVRKGMNLGADDYLPKPFTRAEVLSAIQSRLIRKNTQDYEIENQIASLTQALNEEHEKHLLKSRLVAMFSHDFRNPLSTILSSSELLKNYDSQLSSDRKRQHLDRIAGSVLLLLQMLDDMLTVVAMEHGHMEYRPQKVDIASFVSTVVEEFRLIYSGQHKFVFEENFIELIESDPKLLRQILNNLISNAAKYSPNGSRVTVRLLKNQNSIQLQVIDEGVGILEKDQEHLFDAFYRADNVKDIKGTGLGLTIVREAVTLCGGKIYVSSELGKGSTFTVELSLQGKNNKSC